MSERRAPSTPATRLLKAQGVPCTEHFYDYEEHGGTRVASTALSVPEHAVVKTLIMEDEERQPLVVLMHGDLEVSTKQMARAIGCRTVSPCKPDVANRHTGYMVGGISPFGTRKPMRVYVEQTILDLPMVYVNGGSRGFLLGLAPADLVRVLSPTPVHVGIRE
jgi:Cys-tRNA(Pro) deacylase